MNQISRIPIIKSSTILLITFTIFTLTLKPAQASTEKVEYNQQISQIGSEQSPFMLANDDDDGESCG